MKESQQINITNRSRQSGLQQLIGLNKRNSYDYFSKDTFNRTNLIIQSYDILKQQQTKLIRNEIYLIRVKVNKITYQNNNIKQQTKNKLLKKRNQFKNNKNIHNQLNNNRQLKHLIQQIDAYLNRNQINGGLKISALEKNSFYITISQYNKLYPNKIKTNTQTTMMMIGQFAQHINNVHNAFIHNMVHNPLIQPLVYNNKLQQNQMKKVRKAKHILKLNKNNLYSIITSAFVTKNIPNENNQNIKNVIHEQSYKLSYRRSLQQIGQEQNLNKTKKYTSNRFSNNTKIQQDQHRQQQIQNINTINYQNQNDSLIHSRSQLKNLFHKDDNVVFSSTQKGYFQIKFKQLQINSALNHLQNLLTHPNQLNNNQNPSANQLNNFSTYNLFTAKFPLKPFLTMPFTDHQVSINLSHKVQSNGQYKQAHPKQRINLTIQLSFFCVPSNSQFKDSKSSQQNSLYWGKFRIYETMIRWKNYINKEKLSRRYVKLKIQFPDVLQRNKYLLQNQQSQIYMKKLCLQYDENPIWTDDIDIKINPQRNKLKILFVQVQQSSEQIKSIIAQKTIFLLQQGFLFDKIQSTKHLPLFQYNTDKTQSPHKIADLTIDYVFNINLKDQDTPQKSISDQTNTFVSHYGNIL